MTAADWRAAGVALAPLDDITVLLLIGVAPVPLAAVARGAAGAVAAGRRVAVFDLAGAFGLSDEDGLVPALRDGRSLNALARPLDDGSDERFLVPRGPGELNPTITTHERWPKLVHGFRATGALLILVVPRGLEGIGAFVAQADRAFRLVDRDGAATLEPWVVSPPPEEPAPDAAPSPAPATVAESAPDRIRHSPSHVVMVPPARRRSRKVLGISLVVTLALGATGWIWWDRAHGAARGVAAQQAASPARQAPAQQDTLSPPAVLNPGDSIHAAQWGVELEATNDRTDANFRLAAKSPLPAGTVSPVLLGGDAARWFKIVAGAFTERANAELLRSTLRQTGRLERSAGVVARVPLALRLDTALAPAIAKARAAGYVTRGIAAYPLQRDDGLVTVYAGAFATPEQAGLLLTELRSAGLKPDLVFRVGRTY